MTNTRQNWNKLVAIVSSRAAVETRTAKPAALRKCATKYKQKRGEKREREREMNGDECSSSRRPEGQTRESVERETLREKPRLCKR